MLRAVVIAFALVACSFPALAAEQVAQSSIKPLKEKKEEKPAKAIITYVCHGGKTAGVIVHSTGPGKFTFKYDRGVCATEWSSES